MKIKTLYLSIFLFLGFQFSFAQSAFLDTWNTLVSYSVSTVPSSDGGFVVAFTTQENFFDLIQLVKYDECNNIAFTKKFSVENHHMRLTEIILSSDGFYYIFGQFIVDNLNMDFFILKLDEGGNEISFQVMGNSNLLKDIPYTIQEMSNGNLMIFGNSRLGSNSGNNFFLVLDTQGNIIFEKAYFDAPTWGYATACSDGFLGRMGRLIYKVDFNGNLVWANEYDGIRYATQLLEVNDGYVGVSFSGSHTLIIPHFLFKLNKDGSVAWTSRNFLGYLGGRGYPYLKSLPNGNFVVLDNSTDDLNPDLFHLQLLEFSSDGELLDHQTLTSIYDLPATISKDVNVLLDGSVIFAASSGIGRDTLKVGKTNIDLTFDCVDVQSIDEEDFTTITYEPRSTNIVDINFEKFNYDLVSTNTTPTNSRACESDVITFPPEQNDTTICAGEEMLLDFFLLGATYEWQDGSNASSFRVTQEGNYEVLIEKCGSSVTRTVQVELDECPCDIQTPNVFTPDSDGVNDDFQIISDCELFDFQMKIYNRWGQIVFQSSDPNITWDGTANGKTAPSDVYVYFYQYRFNRGFNLEMQSNHGDLTLIR